MLTPAMLFSEQIQTAGFAVVGGVLGETALNDLRQAAELAIHHPNARSRRGSGYGLRNLFETMPQAREVAKSPELLEIIRSVLGPAARPVKGILFDKTPEANWAVPWHQDVTISVTERKVVAGFDAWSEKDGLPHVQPPAEILEQILAVRLHLDPCPADNGALKVIPGSHIQGRLSDADIEHWKATVSPVICEAAAGDVLCMRPLLLHSSSPASRPAHRRVVHIEYAATELPGGLLWGH